MVRSDRNIACSCKSYLNWSCSNSNAIPEGFLTALVWENADDGLLLLSDLQTLRNASLTASCCWLCVWGTWSSSPGTQVWILPPSQYNLSKPRPNLDLDLNVDVQNAVCVRLAFDLFLERGCNLPHALCIWITLYLYDMQYALSLSAFETHCVDSFKKYVKVQCVCSVLGDLEVTLWMLKSDWSDWWCI